MITSTASQSLGYPPYPQQETFSFVGFVKNFLKVSIPNFVALH